MGRVKICRSAVKTAATQYIEWIRAFLDSTHAGRFNSRLLAYGQVAGPRSGRVGMDYKSA